MRLEDYMTMQEAVEMLHVSRQSIYNMIERYQWNTVRLGGARLLLRADVEKNNCPKRRQ